MSTRLATYVDRTGKPPAAPVTLRLESADAVRLAKFFVGLGFTAEKQTTPQGGPYVLAQATNVQLQIFPSRAPQPAADWNMTLLVDDLAAAVARVEAAGGNVASPIKEIPGGQRCVVESFAGHRVVVAQLAATAQTAPTTLIGPTVVGAAPAVEESPEHKTEFAFVGTPTAVAKVAGSEFKLKTARSKTKPQSPPRSPPRSPPQSTTNSGAASPAAAAPPAVVAPPPPDVLRTVRIACGLTAVGIFFPAFGAAVEFSTAVSSWRDVDSVMTKIILLACGGTFARIAAKWLCFRKKSEVVDVGPVKRALQCEVAAIALALLAYIVHDDVFVVPLVAVAVSLIAASPFLFVTYLKRVAEALAEPDLISSSERAERLLKAAAQGAVGIAVLSAVAYLSGLGLSVKGILLVVAAALAALAAAVLYMALLVAFVVNKKLRSASEPAGGEPSNVP